MTINSVSSSLLSQQLLGSMGSNRTGSTGTAQQAGASSAQLSELGNYMPQLEKLLESDPEAYKDVTAQIADKLNDAASEAAENGDTARAKMLTELAGKFQTASENGTAVDLRPSGPPPGGGRMGPPPMGPPPESDDTTTDATGSAADSWTTLSAENVAALFRQNASSDPMSVLTEIMSGLFTNE